MLDLKLMRRDPEVVRAALARRGGDVAGRVDDVLALDVKRRELTTEAERVKAAQNQASKAIAAAKRDGEDVTAVIAATSTLAERGRVLRDELAIVDGELEQGLRALPNLPDPTAADADTVVREVGDATKEGLDHLALAGDRIDTERGARLSGSRFAYLRGDLALLELAVVNWVLHKLRAHGHEPVIPPVLVRQEALYGTGFLPDTEQQIYHLPADDLYLVGTSEVALASLHSGEILDADALPVRYAGFSPCFRREAGSAGKDTRGIFRVHQFDKVEMFSFVEPAMSGEEHERLLAIEEDILGQLGIPYRVVNIAVDDLGASATKKFDCEAWLPGQGRYRELTSCSNTTDFQARRLDIRMRRAEPKAKPETLHTLNGTAVAVGRTIIALLENGQQADGTIALPSCLAPWGAPPLLAAAAG
jgi:seryl-tRNA synthetase